MKHFSATRLGKLIAVATAACALLAVAGRSAHAFTDADADTAINAYLQAFVSTGDKGAFIKGKQDGGKTGFWQEIEEIEGVLDANDRTGGAYKTQVVALLDGFVKDHGTSWSNNDFNDDIAWAVIAYTRGYTATGDQKYLDVAKSNFDMMFARAWDPATGALFWKTNTKSYNSCIECPAGIASFLLGETLNDPRYATAARDLYLWNKAHLFNAETGAVLDSVGVDGKMNNWSSTYNQGTFIGLANFLGDAATAKLAADYTMNKMGKANASGLMILPQYDAGGGDLAGFHSIGLRWISRFMKERGLEATYLPWLQANADAAWKMRRTSDNLGWNRWLEPTPKDDVLHSWDAISTVVALQVVPPSEPMRN